MEQKIAVKVDSGAVENCIPQDIGNEFKVKSTPGSKAGMKFRAANGTAIDYYGERKVRWVISTGKQVNMTLQVMDVTKPLGSVSRMVQEGNTVIFSQSGSKIVNDKTGSSIPLRETGGAYELDIWYKGGKCCHEVNHHPVNVQNRFAALSDDNDDSVTFARQVTNP